MCVTGVKSPYICEESPFDYGGQLNENNSAALASSYEQGLGNIDLRAFHNHTNRLWQTMVHTEYSCGDDRRGGTLFVGTEGKLTVLVSYGSTVIS